MKRIVLLLLCAVAAQAATPHVQIKIPAFTTLSAPTNQEAILEPMRTASVVATRRAFTDTAGQTTFSNAPAGRYRLHLPGSGLAVLELEIPDTSGVIQAVDYVVSAGFTAPAPAAGLPYFRGISYLWPADQGAAGTALKNDGTGILSWGTVSNLLAGGINTALRLEDALFRTRYVTNANATVTTNTGIFAYNGATNATFTLPTAATASNLHVTVKIEVDNTTTNLTIAAASGDRIDFATTQIISNKQPMRLYSAGGTNWFTH